MKWKTIFIVSFITLLFAGMAGCNLKPVDKNGDPVSHNSKTNIEITETAKKDVVLRIATISTDNPLSYELTNHIKSWASTFEENYGNVDVVIESMSAVERIQTELMAGRGPDVLLLPTTSTWEKLNSQISVGSIPIQDVNLAMRNGIFYDISEYYDADSELNKDALVPAVMDAGVVDGKRFVLPLRYNILTAYVDLDRFTKTGLSTDIFEKDIIGFWDALTEYGNGPLASSALIRSQDYSELNLIGELIDYDNQEVLLTQDVLVEYLRSQKNFLITRGENEVSFYPLLEEYCESGFVDSGWMNVMRPKAMFVGGLDFAICNAVIAEAESINLAMYPLRSTDGSVTADITFYGAVTGGCENPELAYEFLRYFLTEESQWEYAVEIPVMGIGMAPGWPVMVKGSANAMYDHLREWTWKIALNDEETQSITEKEPYTEDDIPILNVTIDQARFPTGLEGSFHYCTASVYNVFTGEQTYDLESAAAEFIEDLEWHVGEG